MDSYLPFFLSEDIYLTRKNKRDENKSFRKNDMKWFIGVKADNNSSQSEKSNEFLEKIRNSIPIDKENINTVFFKDLSLIKNQIHESGDPDNPLLVLFFGVTPGEIKIAELDHYYNSFYHEGINYLLAEDISILLPDPGKKKILWEEMKKMFG